VKFVRLFGEKGLSLERLRSLVEVDEAGSIAAAAPDDESRQSQISRQLKQLEQFFHVELKRKAGKTVRLTAEGRELARLARGHLRSLEEFGRHCVGQPGEVTLGAGDSLLHWVVLPRLKKLREALGGCVVHLHDRRNLDTCQALQDHVIDLGLLRSDLVRPPLTGTKVGSFGYSLFVPDRLWPRRQKATEEQLLQELPLATQGRNTLFQRRLEELVASRGWRMNVRLFTESFPQAAQALGTGEVAAILPDLARLSFAVESTWVMPLKSLSELRRDIVLAWHPHHLETRPHVGKVVEKVAKVVEFRC